MLDDEFFDKNPISIYHGIKHQSGSVYAIFSNPRVEPDGDIYLVNEAGMHRGIVRALEHQRRFPQDNHNAQELQVKKRALLDVQREKQRCGIPLDAPAPTGRDFLTIVHCQPACG